MVEEAHLSRRWTARQVARMDIRRVRPATPPLGSGRRRSVGRTRDRSRLAHPNATIKPEPAVNPATTRIATLASNGRRGPDEDRPHREPEVAPEAVDAGDRAAPPRFGDVGDDGEQRRVDHRRPDPRAIAAASHGPKPDDRRHRGDRSRLEQHPDHDQALPTDRSEARRSRLDDAPCRRVGRREEPDLAEVEAGRQPDDRQQAPHQAVIEVVDETGLATRPTAIGPAIVLRQASRSQRGAASGGADAAPLSEMAWPWVSRTKSADAPSPSPAIAIPRKNGAGRRPAESAIAPVRNAINASAR